MADGVFGLGVSENLNSEALKKMNFTSLDAKNNEKFREDDAEKEDDEEE